MMMVIIERGNIRLNALRIFGDHDGPESVITFARIRNEVKMTIEYYILITIFIFLHLIFITAVIRFSISTHEKQQERQIEPTPEVQENEKTTPENQTSNKPSPEHVKYVDEFITECIFADRKPKH